MVRRIGLNFHGIGTPTRTLEEGESPYWLSEAQFNEILDRVVASPDPAAFVLTFDDGNQSDFDIARPALMARGLTARFFVLTDRLDAPGSLTRDQVTGLLAAGMRIGSHGAAHVAWTEQEAEGLEREIFRSRDILQTLCGEPLTEAGIPFGMYNARVLRALKRAGYQTVFSSDAGYMDDSAFLRPRTSLRGDMSQTEIEAVLAGHMPPARRLRRAVGMFRKRLFPLR
ncbi:polysaccharide deacetylase family protein [Ruegeria sp.]|uniref:polysaccharide deacetylase family protein n=1 Tax=Ruegeria sp. TaxID=1879320 RepID=UPI003B5B69E3